MFLDGKKEWMLNGAVNDQYAVKIYAVYNIPLKARLRVLLLQNKIKYQLLTNRERMHLVLVGKKDWIQNGVANDQYAVKIYAVFNKPLKTRLRVEYLLL